jgi:tetratricopeptide (TPR) repeat protein
VVHAEVRASEDARATRLFPIEPSYKLLLLGMVLAIGTVLLYRPVDRFPFIHTDDPRYITENPNVQAGLSLRTIRWALTTHEAANWHPLTWISHAIDFQLFGLNSARHHDMNVVFHALNATILFLVLVNATEESFRSFVVAALFAVHPMNVESVVWMTERKTLLSMFFLLLALGAYQWYARKPRVGSYVVVLACFALALMAKPMAVTFPLLLLLWDYWPLQRALVDKTSESDDVRRFPPKSLGYVILEKVPLLICCLISARMTIAAQFEYKAETWFPLSNRIGNALISYARYLGKAFWPTDLAFLYPHPPTIPASQVITATLLLLAITVGVTRGWRERYLTVGWLWFLGAMVPMIGLVQVGKQAMADRYAYLPYVGLFLMVVWGAAEVLAHFRVPRVWAAGVAVAAIAIFAAVTHHQLGYWIDDETLWTHTLQVTTDNFGAEDALGTELWRLGQIEEAEPHFLRAERLLPYDFTSNFHLGMYDAKHGALREALYHFKVAAGLDNILPSQRAAALDSMGLIYLELQDWDNARKVFSLALSVNRNFFGAWIGLGVAIERAGQPELAAKAYFHAVHLQPSDWAYILMAGALERSGHNQEAERALEHAKQISSNLSAAKQAAAQILGEPALR